MFKSAITRKPGMSYPLGITTADLGVPDLELALKQHSNYIEALQTCGLEVIALHADEAFPDSCFVEDTAIVLDEAAIITRPGAPSRTDEIKAMHKVLRAYRRLEFIEPPGTLEGGDVLQVDRHFFVGLTARTNEDGAIQLGRLLEKYGYTFEMVPVGSVLHLKTAVNYIGHQTMLVGAEMLNHPSFKNYKLIPVADEDLYAANCLYINGHLIMPAGFDRVRQALQQAGYNPVMLEMSEFEKMDGGLTCLSLRF